MEATANITTPRRIALVAANDPRRVLNFSEHYIDVNILDINAMVAENA